MKALREHCRASHRRRGHRRRGHHRRGLTLIETSLAAGIAAVLSVALAGAIAAGAKSVEVAAASTVDDGDSALALLRRDIDGAIRGYREPGALVALLHPDGTHGPADGQPDPIVWTFSAAHSRLERTAGGETATVLEGVASVALTYEVDQ